MALRLVLHRTFDSFEAASLLAICGTRTFTAFEENASFTTNAAAQQSTVQQLLSFKCAHHGTHTHTHTHTHTAHHMHSTHACGKETWLPVGCAFDSFFRRRSFGAARQCSTRSTRSAGSCVRSHSSCIQVQNGGECGWAEGQGSW